MGQQQARIDDENEAQDVGFWKPIALSAHKVTRLLDTLNTEISLSHRMLRSIFETLCFHDTVYLRSPSILQECFPCYFPLPCCSLIIGYVDVRLTLEAIAFVTYLIRTYAGTNCAHYPSIWTSCQRDMKSTLTGFDYADFKDWVTRCGSLQEWLAFWHAFGYDECLQKVWNPRTTQHFMLVRTTVTTTTFISSHIIAENQNRIITTILCHVFERRETRRLEGYTEMCVIFCQAFSPLQCPSYTIPTLSNPSIYNWILHDTNQDRLKEVLGRFQMKIIDWKSRITVEKNAFLELWVSFQ